MFKRFQFKPSALICSEKALGIVCRPYGSIGGVSRSIGSFLVGTVDSNRVSSIDAEDNKAYKFEHYRHIIYPVFLLALGTTALCLGWWHLFCRSGKDLTIGAIGLPLGILLSVWGWLILTDRIGI